MMQKGIFRRYKTSDFKLLSKQSGFALCDSQYFMYFLSLLYLLNSLVINSSNVAEKN
jgi:hypothetical protein